VQECSVTDSLAIPNTTRIIDVKAREVACRVPLELEHVFCADDGRKGFEEVAMIFVPIPIGTAINNITTGFI